MKIHENVLQFSFESENQMPSASILSLKSTKITHPFIQTWLSFS